MTERKWPPDDDPHGHRPASSTHTLPTASDALPDPGGAADSGRAVASDRSSEDRTQLLAENAELKDRLLRALAEVENTRRRAERDLDNMRQYAITKFAGDMLNVADNLERAIASIPASVREPEAALRTLVEGVGLTEKELLRALEKHGIRKLDPLGERFDPNLHEALFEVPDPSVPRGTVMKVLQPGYAIGSRVLRPAKVGIASGA
ncbi:nucleotide exchange factor GrpE [Bradyrhizobium sp. B120]|uniref:nucleotide exchange factor GrpE n=1 Tax=Bradyrhizobium sp. B120 TaxID=3410088 RepID=UPI003B97F153